MELGRYLDFDLQITRLGPAAATYRARANCTSAGQATADFMLPAPQDQVSSIVEQVLALGAPRAEPGSLAPAETFGAYLFATIFSADIRDCLSRALEDAGRRQAKLRIRLRLNEVPELVNLPWEFLYWQGHGGFLALSPETPLVHYLDLPRRDESLVVPRPLRILVVVADVDTPDFPRLAKLQAELAGIHDALAPAVADGSVKLDTLPRATLAGLQHMLRGPDGYHVLHFTGHGMVDRQGQGRLIFCGETGGVESVPASVLASVLGGLTSLRLAVLSACEGSWTSMDAPFSGTAQTLVEHGLPAVVAMQYPVSDDAARTFAGEFYAALADHYSIEAAVAEARKAVSSRLSSDEWGTPRLIMHAADGMLWRLLPPVDPRMPAIMTGLAALASLVEASPPLHDRLVQFRSDFETISRQLAILANYKALHDLLHTLELQCYNVILAAAERLPGDAGAAITLSAYEDAFAKVVTDLESVAGRPDVPPGEVTWIADLRRALGLVQPAIAALDGPAVKSAMRPVKRVLAIYPSAVNQRLNAVAHLLRLAPLAQLLLDISQGLDQPDIDRDRVAEFATGAEGLAALSRSLGAQIDEHDHWQAIDVLLRLLESELAAGAEDLASSWPDLKEMMQPLLAAAGPADWAGDLQAKSNLLDQALAANNPAAVAGRFGQYRHSAAIRFYNVDVALKEQFAGVSAIGASLAAVARVLA